MSQKTYWRGIEELQETPEFLENKEGEFFGTDLSPLDLMEEAQKADPTPRRDFLKMMGFSLTADTLAASCEIPVRKVVPYIVRPDELVPGKPNFYATTFADGGDYCAIVVKTREGRPIKIEGNTKSSITKGGTSAKVQASVNLYDTARLKNPRKGGKDMDWANVDSEINTELAAIAAAGGQVRILSSSIASPSTKKVIADFIAKYPTTKHITRDAVSYSAMIEANEKSFGIKAIPAYNFDKADVIVSFGADFLGTWISPVEYSKQYSTGRRIDANNPKMSKHIQVESMFSMTGANADERIAVKPSEVGLVAASVLAKLNGGAASSINPETDKKIELTVAALKAAQGKALVVCGVNDINIQTIVNAINNQLGSYGATISFDRTCNIKQGVDADFNGLVAEMKSGAVQALMILDTNPAYDAVNAKEFETALKSVKLSISFNEYNDETTNACVYSLPTSHFLESWGDAEAYTGLYSLQQPTITQLFKTRPLQESILRWIGVETDYHTYIKNSWQSSITPGANWMIALSDGVLELPASIRTVTYAGDAAAAVAALAPASKDKELVLYEKVSIGDGKYANNPWLQEMPDPITKCVWDNYVLMSVTMGEELGITTKKFGGVPRDKDDYEYPRETVTVKVGTNEVTLPVIFQPGLPPQTIAIAVGYGRKNAGIVGNDKGANVFAMATAGVNTLLSNKVNSITVTGDMYKVAQTQTHHVLSTDDETTKRSIIREATIKTFEKDVKRLKTERGNNAIFAKDSLYPTIEYKAIKWGLNVDLNTCTGCGACAIACHSENNVAVVGKSEVLRIHEMHWMRIDRYYQGDINNPKVVFQPVMCQHCDNAPCENVCPVNASNHSSEGINQMAYNRCIGTRYCANNCPYKVRRFNWLDWNNNDSFSGNTDMYVSKEASIMGDSLTRMVLNPDVTVRSRGVIEKCSFCVQKIQEGKLTAKLENRVLRDGDVKSACQTACPTDAITFGNILDETSKIHEKANDPLAYTMLEEINVKPAVTYMMKVRNIDAPLYEMDPIKAVVEHDEHSEHHEDHNNEAPHKEAAHH
jgi:molybdopterin-containing oxidoreductase family iron-sulfur binding subunit